MMVTFAIQVLNFGATTVFIILLAEITESLLEEYVDLTKCHWILIFGGLLCPTTWMGTPKEFW